MTSVFELLTKQEFLAYFTTSTEFSQEDTLFTGFLRAMFETAQIISKNPQNPTPFDIIEAIEHNLRLEQLNEEVIVEIAADERLQRLNAAELFVLLWFLICRNFFDPKQTVYLQMAQNGTVGRLLARLIEMT